MKAGALRKPRLNLQIRSMKFLALFSLVIISHSGHGAVPLESQLLAGQLKQSSVDLFTSGKPQLALTQLRSGLSPEKGMDGSTTALVQGLVEISCTLHNQRRPRAAKEVAQQALLAAQPILQGRSAAAKERQSEILISLGILHETIIGDLETALGLYSAAHRIGPAKAENTQRIAILSSSIALRNSRVKK